jgi:hypothetical protein
VWAVNVIADVLGSYEVPAYVHGIFLGVVWSVLGIKVGRFLNGEK